MTSVRRLVIAAGFFGFTGVALGAFGAHALKENLAAKGTAFVWHTAVLYHLVHAVALLALAGWTDGWPKSRWIGWCWIVGIIMFSGSLYWLALGGPKFLGPVTPLGGLAFLLGWMLLAWNAISQVKT